MAFIQGSATPPKPPVAPLDPPLRDGLRGSFLDLENGAIWPLNGLRAKKIPRFQDQGGWILDPWGGRVNARNEKTRPGRRVLSESRRVRALFDRVTGPKRDPATETPFQSSGIQSHSSSKIPPRTCYQWPLPVAHKAYPARLGIMSCRRVGCRGRPEGNPHIWPSVRPRITASYASQA